MARRHSSHRHRQERLHPSNYDQYMQRAIQNASAQVQDQPDDQGQPQQAFDQSRYQQSSGQEQQRQADAQEQYRQTAEQNQYRAAAPAQYRQDAGQGQYQQAAGQGQYRPAADQGQYRQAATQQQYRAAAQAQQRQPIPQMQQENQYSRYDAGQVRRVRKKKHSRKGRKAVIAIVLAVLVLVGAGGFTGWTLYNSAKQVRSDASAVMTELSDLKDQVVAGEGQRASETARSLSKHAADMVSQTSGWAWSIASLAPVYGADVAQVRELSRVLSDLTDNAVMPLTGQLSQVSLSSMLQDGAINIELAQQLIAAVNQAAPVIERNAKTLSAMGESHFDQVNQPLSKAREMMQGLNAATQFAAQVAPAFPDMMGASGQRTYLIVAQSCAEIRSTGGFLGSLGPLYLTDGRIELGDFRGVKSIYPDVSGAYAPLTDEEVNIFGVHVGYQIADASFIPDWSRVSEIVKYAWEDHGLGQVDGVIAVDPVFLQSILGLVGSVTTSTGVTVDGSNTAQMLLRDVYYLPGNEEQDALFEEVASLSFDQLMNHLGDVQLTRLADTVSEGISSRHLQVWMSEVAEEDAIVSLGADGKLSHDAANPVLGVYFAEESYSKLFWYFKAETEVGEGIKNPDGTWTYPVTVTYRNMVQPGQEDDIPPYAKSHNGKRRSDAEMITWVQLAAPEGGVITDVVADGDFMPPEEAWRTEGAYFNGEMMEATLQGLDYWYGFTRTLPGESFTVTCKVTTAAGAKAPLKVVRTPNAQEIAGW